MTSMKVSELMEVMKRRNTVGYITVKSKSHDEELCFSCGPAYVANHYGEYEVREIDAGIGENVGDGLFHTTIILTIN